MERNALRVSAWVSAAWLIPAVLGAVNELAQRRLRGEPGIDVPALLFGAGDWLIYAALTPAVFALSARLPLVRPHLGRRLVVHLVVALLFAAAWAAAGTMLKAALLPRQLWGSPSGHFAIWLFITLPFGVAVYLGLVGAEHGLRYFGQLRERELAMARLAEQLASARLAALEARVHPHFLFNTLNTVTVLVRERDSARASRILEHFGDLLRRTLHQAELEVTVSRELDLVRGYLEIERERFSDRLRTRVEVEPELLGAALPAFALQHLVENAIRHGVARSADAGMVEVLVRKTGEMLEVTVADDGPGPGDAHEQPDGGLASTRGRLRAHYGDAATLAVEPREPRGTVVRLRIPYRELEADSADG